jgi:hypothetical protein
MPEEIDRDHAVVFGEVGKLPAPVMGVARVAVDEEQRRISGPFVGEKQLDLPEVCEWHIDSFEVRNGCQATVLRNLAARVDPLRGAPFSEFRGAGQRRRYVR